MKKLCLFFLVFMNFVFVAYSQKGEAIYTISDNTISVKSQFLDSFYLGGMNNVTPYVLKKSEIIIPSSSSYGEISLQLLKFKNEENEPADFNVIEILKNGTKMLSLVDSNGFKKISSYVKSQSGFYTFITLTNDTYAFIFNGCIYASQPSLVTIILIHKGQPKLVYNKPMIITALTTQTGSLSMNLQANTCEYPNFNSTSPTEQPDMHSIWWDGSVLKYR